MNKIVLRKLNNSAVPSELYETLRYDCIKQKLFYFSQKLLLKNYPHCRIKQKNYLIYKGIKNYNHFKKFWFCINCLTVFDIKASIKYKTVQRFNLKCPDCNSYNIAHSHSLTKAIIDKMSPSDLARIAEIEGMNIIIDDTAKLKYVPILFLSSQKTESIEPKINFYLQ